MIFGQPAGWFLLAINLEAHMHACALVWEAMSMLTWVQMIPHNCVPIPGFSLSFVAVHTYSTNQYRHCHRLLHDWCRHVVLPSTVCCYRQCCSLLQRVAEWCRPCRESPYRIAPDAVPCCRKWPTHTMKHAEYFAGLPLRLLQQLVSNWWASAQVPLDTLDIVNAGLVRFSM